MFAWKKKTAKKACLIALCAATCLFSAGAGLYALQQPTDAVVAEGCEVVVENEWQAVYKLEDTFVIPDACISYNDQTYTPDAQYLQYPNGSVFHNEEYTLDCLGKYSVIYVANVGSKRLTAEKTFSVLSDAYTAEDASYEYLDKLNMNDKTAKCGLGVALSNGGSFRFNVPVNVQEFSKNDPIAIVYPYNRTKLMGNNGSETQARKITVRLTDCYDESLYVDIVLCWDVTNQVTGNRHPYFRAGASNQAVLGLAKAEPSPNVRSVWLEGVHYRAFDYDKYGAASNRWNSPNADNCGYSIFYDDVSKEIYVQDEAGTYFVNDLDETAIYDRNVFEGFTTGDVYISIFGEDYYASTANVEIEKLGQYSQGDFNQLKEVEDNELPFIEIAADISEPIYIAKGGEFQVFEAYYRDLHKAKDIAVRVYYDYGTERQVQVPMQDGKITATKLGVYTIEYLAEDAYGNRSVKTVALHCVDGFQGKTVALTTEPLLSLQGGYLHVLPPHEISVINGGAYVQIYAVYNGEAVEIDGESRVLFAEQLGEYEIVYRYGDKYHDYEYSYKVTSASSDAIVIQKPILPQYFIKDAPYSLDAGTACLYSGESVAKDGALDVYAKQGDGEFLKLENLDNVRFTGEGKVQFRYNYADAVAYSEEIPVVDVGFTGELQLKEYFFGDFDKEAIPAHIGYYSKKQAGDNTLQFINAIGLSNFTLKFSVPQSHGNFAGMTIRLSDYCNRENCVELVYGKAETGIYFGVLGGETKAQDKSYTDVDWTISYNEKQSRFEIGSNIQLGWESTFTSDRILLQIKLNDMYGNSGIEVMKVNNQTFSGNIIVDKVKPVIKTDVQGEYKMGSVISILPATATDVVTPFFNKNFTFEVVAPSGETVVSLDGIALNNRCDKTRAYEFEIKEYGYYYISYVYKDFKGNRMQIDIPLEILEDVAPTITLDGDWDEMTVQKVAYNSTVKVANFTVTDNKTDAEHLTVYIIVYTPKNEILILGDAKEFVAERRGLYKVCYYCTDEAGNMALRYYNVEVA